MEAGAVPRVAAPRIPAPTPRLIRLASDARLVTLVREGRAGAFEAVYDRHHRGILSFCRHMLRDQHEAEDALQHTFMAAYSSLLASQQPIHLRPWLFAIARNRCYSVLRSQRERPMAELEEPVTDGLAAQVQRRQDLRDLVSDLNRLPDEQRAALVLAELESLSHAEIAEVLGVSRDKVKALVFQAREALLASRTARDTACHEIRQQLAVGRGAALRRGNLRRHLRDCEGCRSYRAQVQRQRRQFGLLLPVVPTLLAKEGLVLAAMGVGGAAAVGGPGLVASSALKTGFLKAVSAALIAGLGTMGTVMVSASDLPVRSLSAGAHSSRGVAEFHRAHHAASRSARVASNRSAAAPSSGGGQVQLATIASRHPLAGSRGRRHGRAAPERHRGGPLDRHHGAAGAGHRHGQAAVHLRGLHVAPGRAAGLSRTCRLGWRTGHSLICRRVRPRSSLMRLPLLPPARGRRVGASGSQRTRPSCHGVTRSSGTARVAGPGGPGTGTGTAGDTLPAARTDTAGPTARHRIARRGTVLEWRAV
jgi:RNA polymerase sigma factor (sigma-70 family)